jgi:hypothetical protein
MYNVVFSPGSMDGLTEEEQAEIKALIEAKIADGSFFTEAQPVDLDELEQEDPELYAKLAAQIEAMPVEGETGEQVYIPTATIH